MKGKKGCAPGVKGLGKAPSKTGKKTKKMYPALSPTQPQPTPPTT